MAVERSVAYNNHLAELEHIVAGGMVSWSVNSSDKRFSQRVLEVCPVNYFRLPKTKDIAIAVERLNNKGVSIDLVSVGCELKEIQSSCQAMDLMEFVNLASSSALSSVSVIEAARKLAEETTRQEIVRSFAKMQDMLSGGLPITDIQEHIQNIYSQITIETAKNEKRPLSANFAQYCGTRFLEKHPENYEWLLNQSLPKKTLGVIVGPPGAGKGKLSLGLAAYLAAGCSAFDGTWEPSASYNVLYISAEDSLPVIHRTLHYALKTLPASLQIEAASKITAVPVSGRVSLFDASTGKVLPTSNLSDLRNQIHELQPDIVFLDTMVRFFAVEENNNVAVTEACGFMEELIAECGCSIILIHHVNKAAGDNVDTSKDLQDALNQSAIRGASALAGCVRWALALAPLGSDLAVKRLGEQAKELAPGSFVAARVIKKNIGRQEYTHYFSRDSQGLLVKVEPERESKETSSLADDVQELVTEVYSRMANKENPLSVSGGGQFGHKIFRWGIERYQKAVNTALEEGLLTAEPNSKGKGEILKTVTQTQLELVGFNERNLGQKENSGERKILKF